ncbi:hypothetical protein [Klebsiella pneumoniae]|nr:hypothetical protein [Klebsiella pneumoniae]MBS2816773.1 hypothetical protein [Klebsiella pneumoniae]MCQ0864037.1 hypothetical protein [Klebsiella pneumoniae]GKL90388.1 hypothetical protein NUBL22819_42180 [Klebsiella pneumoniae]HBQ8401227.1 hypothetical protein [Klebsiella pneumoniae]HBR1914538.1 hypothetical protein [Klebsiella pneumoniae]
MLNKHDIYSKIRDDLSGPVGELCRDVVEFLTSPEAKPLKHITYMSLVHGTRLNVESNDAKVLLIKVTDYLSSNRLHLLDMHFQFIETDDSDPIPVDDDDLSYALKTGQFYHPNSGKLVDNYNHHLFPYFTPTDALEQLHE